MPASECPACGVHHRPQFMDRARDPDQQTASDQRMPDVELLDRFDGRHRRDVADREAVAGMDRKADPGALMRGRRKRAQGPGRAECVCELPGVQLDGGGSEVLRGLDGIQIGIDEKRSSYPGGVQCVKRATEGHGVVSNVETTLGGDLRSTLRDYGDLVRAEPECDAEHLLGAGHFEVEDGTDGVGQGLHVGILNVPTILSQMDGDTISSGVLGPPGGSNRIGVRSAACLSQRGDVVDVYVKPLAWRGRSWGGVTRITFARHI